MRVLDDVALADAGRALDWLSRRQEALAANLANIDTPGYLAVEVSFEAALEEERLRLRRTHAGHLDDPGRVRGETELVHVPGLRPRADGNNVSLDREIRQMSRNRFLFAVAAQLAQSRLQALRTAIAEGRVS
jgi:flagellar basal-body rod protein FlgB